MNKQELITHYEKRLADKQGQLNTIFEKHTTNEVDRVERYAKIMELRAAIFEIELFLKYLKEGV